MKIALERELLSRYLSGQAKPIERDVVEEAMALDPELSRSIQRLLWHPEHANTVRAPTPSGGNDAFTTWKRPLSGLALIGLGALLVFIPTTFRVNSKPATPLMEQRHPSAVVSLLASPSHSPAEPVRQTPPRATATDDAGLAAVYRSEIDNLRRQLAGVEASRKRLRDAMLMLASTVAIPDLSRLASLDSGPLRSERTGERITLRSPVGVRTPETRPLLRWDRFPGHQNVSYTVYLTDERGELAGGVAEDGTSVDQTRFLPPKALQRGGIYLWSVEAAVRVDGVRHVTARSVQARFQVADGKTARLDQESDANEIPLCGIARRASAGFLDQAEEELDALLRARMTPPDERSAAKRLLDRINDLRRHQESPVPE